MKKIACVMILIMIMFTAIGCSCTGDSNRFKIDTIINPKLTLMGSKMAVEYKLGDLLILDEWSGLNAGELLFLTERKDIVVRLKLTCGDSIFSSNYFHYNIGNITTNSTPVLKRIMFEYVNSFPGVTWILKDDNKVPDAVKSQKVEKAPDKNNVKTKGKPIKQSGDVRL